jgi:hypothetical protein
MRIWELRFSDGRGASFYTDEDVTDEIGKAGAIRTVRVASLAFEGTALRDAARCLEKGDVVALTAHMGSVAFAVRHDV